MHRWKHEAILYQTFRVLTAWVHESFDHAFFASLPTAIRIKRNYESTVRSVSASLWDRQ